mgnify:CR=1 FL=1
MIELIDKTIKSLAQAVIDINDGGNKFPSASGNPDYALKLTQAISNLTHSKINLIEYDRMVEEKNK